MAKVILIVAGSAAFAALLFGFSAMYDTRAARLAGKDFGAGAGVHIAPLRRSALLADRLRTVRWGAATRVGINPGRLVIDGNGAHWSPSFLTGRKIPRFSVTWSEVTSHAIESGPKLVGRRVAKLTLVLADGTPVRFRSKVSADARGCPPDLARRWRGVGATEPTCPLGGYELSAGYFSGGSSTQAAARHPIRTLR